MFDLTIFELFILLISGFLVGFSKTAGTSLGAIIIPIMVDVFPAKEATGILCLAFFIASFHGVYHYRYYVQWHYFVKLIPSTIVGLGVGALFMQSANDDTIKLIIGIIILGMLVFNNLKDLAATLFGKNRNGNLFSAFCGILIGFSSIVANAGSPILAIYLLIIGETKEKLIGTLVTFFFFTDIVKIPINIWTDVVTLESLKLNSLMLPLMIAGGFIGIAFVRWVSENRFRKLLETLSFIGAVKLIYRPFINLL